VWQAPVASKWAQLCALPKTLLPQPQAVDRWMLYRLVLTDFLLTAALFVAANVLEIRSGYVPRPDLVHLWKEYLANHHIHLSAGYALIYGALVTLLGYTEGLYDANEVVLPKIPSMLRIVGWATILTSCVVQLERPNSISWSQLVCAGGLSFAGLAGCRAWRLYATLKETRQGNGVRNILIVGRGRLGLQLAAYFERHPQTRCIVKGFLDDRFSSSPDVLGRIEDLSTVARAAFIDEVILSGPYDQEQARRVVQAARLNRLDLRVAPDLFGSSPPYLRVEQMGDVPLISLAHEPLPVIGLLAKRTLDLLLSGAALLFLFPWMAMIAAIVKLDSAGPILYGALRVGKKGRRFRCYKFRTMAVDADAMKDGLRTSNQRRGPCFKIAADPRITRVGRFLRRYSLDELPQLWNVVKGEMSLVGPRPHPVDDFARYQLDHLRRLDVIPGITGLWQVTARQDPSFQTNLKLDLEYIEKWNLWLDLKILCKTFATVVSGSGV